MRKITTGTVFYLLIAAAFIMVIMLLLFTGGDKNVKGKYAGMNYVSVGNSRSYPCGDTGQYIMVKSSVITKFPMKLKKRIGNDIKRINNEIQFLAMETDCKGLDNKAGKNEFKKNYVRRLRDILDPEKKHVHEVIFEEFMILNSQYKPRQRLESKE